MNFTKRVKVDLDPPCQELFVRGLGFVRALLVCWQIEFFIVFIFGPQSSCNTYDNNVAHMFTEIKEKYRKILFMDSTSEYPYYL